MKNVSSYFKSLFSRNTYNFLKWLFCKPFGVIAIKSETFHDGNKLINYNLGDDLNYYLLKELSGKTIINYDQIRRFHLRINHYTCIGSVLEWRVDTSSIVWGTGIMFGDREIICPKKICAVRGPMTRNVLIERGIACPEVYGDPALLLPFVFRPHVKKQYKIGFIPHYSELDSEIVTVFCERYKNEIHLIKMQGYKDWKDVIRDICSCDFIISSSLHGLIISDAYNIPNVWVQLSDNIDGGNFKYFDYFASVGRSDNTPLDYRKNQINMNRIMEKLSEYHTIQFSYKPLIESCPFISNKRKRNLIDRIPICCSSFQKGSFTQE